MLRLFGMTFPCCNAGDVQKWVGGIDKKRAKKAMEEGIEYLKNLKK